MFVLDATTLKKIFIFIYLLIWLCPILVAAHEIFSCGMWDLVPPSGIKPRLPALGMQSRSHWTSSKVPDATALIKSL